MSYALIKNLENNVHYTIKGIYLKEKGGNYSYKYEGKIFRCEVLAFNTEPKSLSNLANMLNRGNPKLCLEDCMSENVRRESMLSLSYVQNKTNNDNSIEEAMSTINTSSPDKNAPVLDFDLSNGELILSESFLDTCELDIQDVSEGNKLPVKKVVTVENVGTNMHFYIQSPNKNMESQEETQEYIQDQTDKSHRSSDREDERQDDGINSSFTSSKEQDYEKDLKDVDYDPVEEDSEQDSDESLQGDEENLENIPQDELDDLNQNFRNIDTSENDQNNEVIGDNLIHEEIENNQNNEVIGDNQNDNETEGNLLEENAQRNGPVTRTKNIYSKRPTSTPANSIDFKVDQHGKLILENLNLNVKGALQCDQSKKIVLTAPKNKRELVKDFCFICGKLIVQQIRRHLRNTHANYPVIQESRLKGRAVLDLTIKGLVNWGNYVYNSDPKTEIKRVARKPNSRKIIRIEIDSSGNLQWPENIDPEKYNANEIIIDPKNPKIALIYDYNVQENLKGDNYVSCNMCLREFKTSTIYKHQCEQADQPSPSLRVCRSSVPEANPIASTILRQKILCFMTKDKYYDLLLNDDLILEFGNYQIEYHCNTQDVHMVSRRLRVLAEFLLLLRKVNPSILCLADVLKSSLMPQVKSVLFKMIEYDVDTKVVGKPNKCTEVTGLIKKLVEFYKNRCIEKGLKLNLTLADEFERLFKETSKLLNKLSRKTLLEKKKSQPVLELPSVDDVKKFLDYLKELIKKTTEKLNNTFDLRAYIKLMESVLLYLQVFNRRRSGEISRLLVTDLTPRNIYRFDTSAEKRDEFVALSPKSQEIARQYIRISVTNKLGLANVGIICHERILESINLILRLRREAKISDTNQFFFAKGLSNGSREPHLKAGVLIDKYARDAGLKNPQLMRGTKLRKQVATMMFALQVEDENLRDLAKFLGHDYKIHMNYYRQQVAVTDIVTLAPMLETASGDDRLDSLNKSSEELTHDESTENEGSPQFQESRVSSEDEDVPENYFAERQRARKENALKQKKKVEERKNKKQKKQNDAEDKLRRVRWTEEEKNVLLDYVREHGKLKTVKNNFLLELKKKNPILKNRTLEVLRSAFFNFGLAGKA